MVVKRSVKFFVQSFADDVVVIAKTPGELKSMLATLKRYADRNKLKISAEKSKIAVLQRRKAYNGDVENWR